MTMLQHSVIESGGYNIDRSLRFRSSASAYLSRTFGTSTNNQKYTVSTWVKRGALSNGQVFSVTNGAYYAQIDFYNDTLYCQDYTASASYTTLQTNAVYRDPSAWYHVVFSIDTTQATASNRANLYINGVQVTSFQSSSYPTQNSATTGNSTNATKYLGQLLSSQYFDGYLAEVNFIDGQALTPSSFGQTDPVTGVWTPKKYTGTYGTNGFYLNFSDNTSATTLAYDKSGNGNNWTPNNISTTAGSTYDSMTDVPTLTSATAANYCVMNPLKITSQLPVTNGNLTATASTSGTGTSFSTISPPSGAWYFETTVGALSANSDWINFGCSYTTLATSSDPQGTGCFSVQDNGRLCNSGSLTSSWMSAWAVNDVLMCAFDTTNGKIWFGKNGTWAASGNPAAGTNAACTFSGEVTPIVGQNSGTSRSATLHFNFGQRPFSYTPPTGFNALNTFNLPDPVIKKPNQYMDATLYTGTGTTTNNITTLGFQPDFVWIKDRQTAYDHHLFDSVRGAANSLYSNATNAENAYSTSLASFNSNGFTITNTGNNQYYLNKSGDAFVSWQWKESATAGFDIVTYTGNGSNNNIPHNLGVAPKMIVTKSRSGTTDWVVYHASVGTGKYLVLNGTGATTTDANYYTATASNSWSCTGSATAMNTNGATYVAYAFAEIPGFSKFGSYTGNGSADGPFVYCGFRPRYIMIKKTDAASPNGWEIWDTARDTYNQAYKRLWANLSDAENTTTPEADILSNGLKVRTVSNDVNTSGGTYIFAAFAENPLKYSLAR